MGMNIGNPNPFINPLIQQGVNPTVAAPQQGTSSIDTSIWDMSAPPAAQTEPAPEVQQQVEINTIEFLENNASIEKFLEDRGIDPKSVTVDNFSAAEVSGNKDIKGSWIGVSYQSESGDIVTQFFEDTSYGQIPVGSQTKCDTETTTTILNPDGSETVSTLDNETGTGIIETYDANNNLTKKTEIIGPSNSTTTNYETGEVTIKNGEETTKTDAQGRILSKTTDKGTGGIVTENYTYNDDGSVIINTFTGATEHSQEPTSQTYTDPNGNSFTVKYHQDANGQTYTTCEEFTDANGNKRGIYVENNLRNITNEFAQELGYESRSDLLKSNKGSLKGGGFRVNDQLRAKGQMTAQDMAAIAMSGKTKAQNKTEGNTAYKKHLEEQKAAAEAEAKAEAEREAAIQKENEDKSYARLAYSKITNTKDKEEIKKYLVGINNMPGAISELNNMFAEAYPEENGYSPLEIFVKTTLGEDEINTHVQSWIDNGSITGDDAIDAQARMAFREATEACDGLGTDERLLYHAASLIKSPTPVGEPQNSQNARAVLGKVNQMIKKHDNGKWANFYSYVNNDVSDSEFQDVRRILAGNGIFDTNEKINVAVDQIADGQGEWLIDKERLNGSLSLIKTPEELADFEAGLRSKLNPPVKELPGRTFMESFLISKFTTKQIPHDNVDYKSIRQSMNVLIANGLYTPEQATQINGRINADQIRNGDYEEAFNNINNPETYKATALALGGDIDTYMKSEGKKQHSIDLLNADLAAKGVITDKNKVAGLATRLISIPSYQSQANGFAAIGQDPEIAKMVDEQLQAKGSSLSESFNDFTKNFDTKKIEKIGKFANFMESVSNLLDTGTPLAKVWNLVSNTTNSNIYKANNTFIQSENVVMTAPSKEHQEAYDQTIAFMKAELQHVKDKYQNIQDGQGAVSRTVGNIIEHHGFGAGTTDMDVNMYVDRQEAMIRDLEAAAAGKCVTVDGKPVSFETVYQTYNQNEFNPKVAKEVNTQGQRLAVMKHANEEIPGTWNILTDAMDSNDPQALTGALVRAKNTLGRFSGMELSFADGYTVSDGGVLLGADGKPLSVDQLKDLATKFQGGLADITNSIYGLDPEKDNNAIKPGDKNIGDRLSNIYDKTEEKFKGNYTNFYGQKPPDDVLDSYEKTIENGKKVFNAVVIIGAAAAAPFTGGGSLAGVLVGMASTGITVATASYATSTIESATDADGLTHLENIDNEHKALKDGGGAAAGYGVGTVAKGVGNFVTEEIGAGTIGGKVAGKFVNAEISTAGDFAYSVAADAIENDGKITMDGLVDKFIASGAGSLSAIFSSDVTGLVSNDRTVNTAGKLSGKTATKMIVGTAMTGAAATTSIDGSIDLNGLSDNIMSEVRQIAENVNHMVAKGSTKADVAEMLDNLEEGPVKDFLTLSFQKNPTMTINALMQFNA